MSKNIDLLAAESEQLDIITVSDTWLSPAHDSNQILLPNYHPPLGKDHPNDQHGGVSIYVKIYIGWKPRTDLDVDNLEAVWIKLYLRIEKLLIGSFYRPLNARVNYLDLISECVRKARNVMSKFVILGDFNTDFLSNPSPHLLNILNLYHLSQLTNIATRIN